MHPRTTMSEETGRTTASTAQIREPQRPPDVRTVAIPLLRLLRILGLLGLLLLIFSVAATAQRSAVVDSSPTESGSRTAGAKRAEPLGKADAMGTSKHDLFGIFGTFESRTGSCLGGYPFRTNRAGSCTNREIIEQRARRSSYEIENRSGSFIPGIADRS